jgi:hypothetical protein
LDPADDREAMDEVDFFRRVARGAPPDPDLTQALTVLTTDLGGSALDVVSQPGWVAGQFTEEREPDIWHACVEAWAMLKAGRSNDAIGPLWTVWRAYPPAPHSAELADAELLATLAQTLSRLAAPEAVGFALRCQETVLRFVEGAGRSPPTGGAQIALMLSTFVPGFSAQLAASNLMADVVRPWVVTRGIDLLIEGARLRARTEPALDLVDKLLGDVGFVAESSGTALDERQIAKVQSAVADLGWKDDPETAIACYRDVVRAVGVADPLGLHAAVNLVELFDDAAAESRLGELVTLAEATGDSRTASQVRVVVCTARWRRHRDLGVRDELIGALEGFEREIPRDADIRTRFTFKQHLETGYRLLLTVNACDDDRSNARLEETLSAIRAMTSPDQAADLRPDAPDDPWEITLERLRRPATSLRTALAPLRGVGVLHLAAGIDCVVCVVYGHAGDGRWVFGWDVAGDGAAQRIREITACMGQQLAADKIGDALGVQALDAQLARLGDELGRDLPLAVLSVLGELDLLIYATVPVENLDELPLAAIRIDGRWLHEMLPTTRATTFNQLHAMLGPGMPEIRTDRRAIVVLGAPDVGGKPLTGARQQGSAVQRMLSLLGFEADVAESADRAAVARWLDGGTGALHYVGHGIADEVLESLPLPAGEHFAAYDAEQFRGYHLPFVFLCACVAGRIRYGSGGHLVGLLTGLVDRGAPAGVAFTLPIPERHAYAVAAQFYRQAAAQPFAEAVASTQQALRAELPAYVWLSIAAFGDPVFALPAKASGEPIPTLRSLARTWHSAVRLHCVLRTEASAVAARQAVPSVALGLRPLVERWLDSAFGQGDADDAGWADLEQQGAGTPGLSDIERLTARAAASAARLHASGLHRWPPELPADGEQLRDRLSDAMFLVRLGAALFDDRLNGVGLCHTARVKDIWGVSDAFSGYELAQGVPQLWEAESASPFVASLLAGNREILARRGFGALLHDSGAAAPPGD